MPELRRDKTAGRPVVIATERAARVDGLCVERHMR